MEEPWINNARAGGGGGKSKDRRNKLKEKNERLNEQRKRRLQQAEKQNARTKDLEPVRMNNSNGDIHPSRKSRMAIDLYGSCA